MLLCDYVCGDKCSRMSQVVSALALGVLTAPYGSGLFFLVVFRVLYETLVYAATHGSGEEAAAPWDLFTRCSVFYASLFGWVVGRTLMGLPVLPPGVPEMM